MALHKRNPELLRACVKAVCAFLNSEGGILLIGVANSGELTGLEDDIRDFKDRQTIDGFESRFRDALVTGLDPESSHLATMSFPVVRGVQICRVDVGRSPHPVFLVGKNIPQQFYIRDEGALPQPIRCPSCGELIHPPEFYVRKGNASRPLDIEGRTSTSVITGDNRGHPRQLGIRTMMTAIPSLTSSSTPPQRRSAGITHHPAQRVGTDTRSAAVEDVHLKRGGE